MDKKQLLLDSIKKLLALKVSDEEIILNLKDVGVKEALSVYVASAFIFTLSEATAFVPASTSVHAFASLDPS